MDDESWILYNNVSRKRSWRINNASTQIVAKPRLYIKKVLLEHLGSLKTIVYYERLQLKIINGKI